MMYGWQSLGGSSVVLDQQTSQMSRGEPIEDTASVLGSYVDAIVFRANKQADVDAMAEHSGVPVINALTEREHPCQVMADWMALLEHWGDLQGHTFTYVGDGNNMCHSYLLGAAMAGMDIRVATPKGFAPDSDIVEAAEVLAHQNGSTVDVGHDPLAAVMGSDAVATDTWTSMGDVESEHRHKAFKGFQVNDALMSRAHQDAVFMHCLPGHWGQEATYELAHGPRSLIHQQAENRMWVQMAMLHHLLA